MYVSMASDRELKNRCSSFSSSHWNRDGSKDRRYSLFSFRKADTILFIRLKLSSICENFSSFRKSFTLFARRKSSRKSPDPVERQASLSSCEKPLSENIVFARTATNSRI